MNQKAHHSIAAEMSVLGSMILSTRATEETLSVLRDDDFYRPSHQVVFRALKNLDSKKTEIDLVTLRNELQQLNSLVDCGGVDYLVQLAEYVPSAANAEHYAKIVKDHATRRMLVAAARKLQDLADAEDEVPDIVSKAQDLVAQVSDFSTPVGSGFETIQTVLMRIANDVESDQDMVEEDILSKAFDINAVLYPSKFEKLNDLIDGFDPGCVYTIGARSGMGKTAYAIDEACHLAQLGHPVLFVSREMTTEKLVMRFLAKLSNVPFRIIKRRQMSDAERYRFHQAQEFMYALPMFFLTKTRTPITDVKREARVIFRKLGKMPVVVDDFIQTGLEGLEIRIAINKRMTDYKDLAKELKTVVILLSQLSRGSEEKDRPRLSSLKESSAIEELSDVVIFIFRTEYYEARDQRRPEQGESTAEFIVAKNREGPLGTAHLRFRPAFTEFL